MGLLLAACLAGILGFVAIITYVVFSAGSNEGPNEKILTAIVWTTGLSVTVLWMMGVWRLTSPESQAGSMGWPSRLENWIRKLHLLVLNLWLLQTVLAIFFHDEIPINSVSSRLILVFVALSSSIAMTALMLLLIHLRRLSRRIIKPTLTKLISFEIWGGVLLAFVTASMVVLALSFAFNVITMPGMTTTTGPASSSVATVRYSASGVVMTAKTTPTTTSASSSSPTSGPAGTTSTEPAVVPGPMASGMIMAPIAFLIFDLVLLAWGAGWLLALISFFRALKEAVHQSLFTDYTQWSSASSS